MDEMISLIQEAFGDSLATSEWMSPETRKTAQEKVDAILWNVGYPEYILNNTHMDQTYQEVSHSVFLMFKYSWLHFCNVESTEC